MATSSRRERVAINIKLAITVVLLFFPYLISTKTVKAPAAKKPTEITKNSIRPNEFTNVVKSIIMP